MSLSCTLSQINCLIADQWLGPKADAENDPVGQIEERHPIPQSGVVPNASDDYWHNGSTNSHSRSQDSGK